MSSLIGPSTLEDLETQLKRTMDDLAKNASDLEVGQTFRALKAL